MMQVLSRAGRALRLGGPLLALLAVPLTGCGNGDSLVSSESPLPPDTTPPPPDTTTPPPPDTTTPPPPPDTTTPPPPPDSTANPVDCGPDGGASGPPQHVGIPFGPATLPPSRFTAEWTGTIYTATSATCLPIHMANARRVNARLFVSFTGNEQYNRDANGFSMTKWKERVDRFRSVDLTSYIEDGTILGHFIMDEPSDPSNWSGKPVTQEQIEEMARYSKEIWPTMPTMIRAWPEYLLGGQYPHLDAIRFHYLELRGPLDAFIEKNMREAQALGLAVVGGLNVLNGGSKNSGIPGRADNKYGMSASEIRAWGTRFLNEPGLCAFFLWEHDDAYLSRSDIKAALDELAAQARNYPQRPCRR